MAAIAVGVTVIALQAPPGLYACPTTKYCLDLAKAVGVQGPVLVPSEPELTNRTGLSIQDRLFYFGDFPSFDQSDVPDEPLWLLRYDLSEPGNLRPGRYFLITDLSLWTEYGAERCPRQLVKFSGGSSDYVTSAVAPGGRRFCYGLRVGGGYVLGLEARGRLGPLGYIIRLNSNPVRAFSGGATSPAALHWVEGVVGSLKVEP